MAAQRDVAEWMEELHVSERGSEEEGYAVHYMLDPGDGLCSTLVEGMKRHDAEFLVTACNSHFDLLDELLKRGTHDVNCRAVAVPGRSGSRSVLYWDEATDDASCSCHFATVVAKARGE